MWYFSTVAFKDVADFFSFGLISSARQSHNGILLLPTVSCSLSSQKNVTRPDQLEKEARRLGRSLVRSGDEDDDDDDDYDDDMMDMEASNVIFTPLLRSGHQTDCLTGFHQLIHAH